MELENSIVVKNFTEVEDMIESIFESMPQLTLQLINNNNKVKGNWKAGWDMIS